MMSWVKQKEGEYRGRGHFSYRLCQEPLRLGIIKRVGETLTLQRVGRINVGSKGRLGPQEWKREGEGVVEHGFGNCDHDCENKRKKENTDGIYRDRKLRNFPNEIKPSSRQRI